jgi:hypothetical protein
MADGPMRRVFLRCVRAAPKIQILKEGFIDEILA